MENNHLKMHLPLKDADFPAGHVGFCRCQLVQLLKFLK